MPNLSKNELDAFNAVLPNLKSLWDGCNIPEVKNHANRYIPKGYDSKRVDLIPWLSSIFERAVVDNLLEFQKISFEITEDLLNSVNNSESTKVKKLTLYRKLIADSIGETYSKNSYNLIPYALFTFPDSGELVKTNNRNYTDKIKLQNDGINRIPITEVILNKLIHKAVKDLRTEATSRKDYGAKMLAMELLTGRRQFEEILKYGCDFTFFNNSKFSVVGLAKCDELKKQTTFILPYLGVNFQNYQGELAQLLTKNLKLLREFVVEKSELKSPLSTLLNTIVTQASIEYDDILKPVRSSSNLELINGKTHLFRKIYAFSCYVFLDGCQSNESQFFADKLAEGTIDDRGIMKLNDITAKSYSIFRLVETI